MADAPPLYKQCVEKETGHLIGPSADVMTGPADVMTGPAGVMSGPAGAASIGYRNPTPRPPGYSSPPDAPPPSYDSLFGKVKAAKAKSSRPGDFLKHFMEMTCSACIGKVANVMLYGLMLLIPVAMIVVGALTDCPAEPYIPIYLMVGGGAWLIWLGFVFMPWNRTKEEESMENTDREEPVQREGGAFGQEGGATWIPLVPSAPPLGEEVCKSLDVESQEKPTGALCQTTEPTDDRPLSSQLSNPQTQREQPPDSAGEVAQGCTMLLLILFIFGWFIAGNVWVYRTSWQGDNTEERSYCQPLVYLFTFWLITGTYITIGTILFCICAVTAVTED